MQNLNPYERKYKQLNLLGKGNFGKVYKVKLNNGKEGKDASYFVAKKMFLEGLSEEQIKFAYGQIEILQRLNQEIKKNSVPFIVGYEQFFRVENELIIIMEYCEEGELSGLIKNLRKNNQRLSEKIIGYWFTQLLFGLRVLHSKNILHRDLKSANVFLTKNYSLKIGDFGISKVLQKSSAITCIGTPLYLSPEVCNNQPYSYSSDLWALACIVYEMCSLKYPFQASNMIVLAKKIVMDKVEPIPHYFSRELNDIVMNLFEKEPKKRMSADQIFKTPYFTKITANFIQDIARIKELATPIDLEEPKKTEQKVVTAEEQQTMKTISSVVERTGGSGTLSYTGSLTAKERIALKKQEQIRQKQKLLAQAARDNYASNLQQAKQTKNKNMKETGNFAQTQKNKKEIQVQQYNKTISELKNKQKKERQDLNWAEKLQELPVAGISNTINNIKIKDVSEEEFQDVPPLPGNSSFVPIPYDAVKTKKPSSMIAKVQKKEQEIQEEIIQQNEQLQQYYDDDFEQYEEPTVTQKIQMKREEEDIVSFFQNEMGLSTMSPSKKTMVQQALKPIECSVSSKVSIKEKECIKLVGEKRFKELKQLFLQGKVDKTSLPKNPKFSSEEKKTFYYIEEIMELQQS